jgi:hypothetical protein
MKPEEAFYFAETHPELLAGALMDEEIEHYPKTTYYQKPAKRHNSNAEIIADGCATGLGYTLGVVIIILFCAFFLFLCSL